MKKSLAVLNAFVIAVVIVWNYFANAKGINQNSVGSLSAAYDNFFTPASYAFSIWGIIYLYLIGQAIYQLRLAFRDNSNQPNTGWELIAVNIGNGLWIWAWLTENTGLSVIIMVVILLSLLRLITRLNIGKGHVTKSTKVWVWGPVSLYSGWITVATIANISAYLAKIHWYPPFSEPTATILMISIATIVYTLVLQRRKMIIFSSVGVWAIMAIAVKQWNNITSIQWSAIVCATILAIAIIYSYINRKRYSQLGV